MSASRTEYDNFGGIEVPAGANWGAQTQRSIAHFPFPPHERMPIAIIAALAQGTLDADLFDQVIDPAKMTGNRP